MSRRDCCSRLWHIALWVQRCNRRLVSTIVFNRFVMFALFVPRDAAIGVGFGKIGVQRNRLVVVFNRLIVFALLSPRDAAIVVGFGILWVQRNRPCEVFNRFVVCSPFLRHAMPRL